MASRYDRRAFFKNFEPQYVEYFSNRGEQVTTLFPIQWHTSSMRYPTAEEIKEFNVFDYIWKQGDRFFKLAHQYYGDSKLWWIIPWFNKRPFVADYKFGDLVYIPLSISQVYNYFD